MPTSYLPPKSKAVTVNYEAVRENIVRWGRIGVGNALKELEARAKSRAPVRNVFKGGRRPDEAVPRGIQKRLRYKHQHRVFGRKIRHWTDEGRDRFLRQVNAQTKPNQEIWTTRPEALGGSRVRANTRSWIPIVRRADGTRTTGEFRRITVINGRAVMQDVRAYDEGMAPVRVQRGMTSPKGIGTDQEFLSAKGRQELRRVNVALERAQEIRSKKGQRKLSGVEIRSIMGQNPRYLGTYEKTGKPIPNPVYVSKSGVMTLGGRLRGEIYAEDVKQDWSSIYGDVVSPTHYAKYQEYGTSRHRAQPFMRPALYEMRTRLPQHVKSAIRKERGK